MEPRQKKTVLIVVLAVAAVAVGVLLVYALRPLPATVITDLPTVTSSSTPIALPDTSSTASSLPALDGLNEQEATSVLEAAGYSSRITSRDGESFPATADYRPDRVNLDIANGHVVGYTLG